MPAAPAARSIVFSQYRQKSGRPLQSQALTSAQQTRAAGRAGMCQAAWAKQAMTLRSEGSLTRAHCEIQLTAPELRCLHSEQGLFGDTKIHSQHTTWQARGCWPFVGRVRPPVGQTGVSRFAHVTFKVRKNP